MKKIILLSLVILLNLPTIAQTYRVGKVVEKIYKPTMESEEADSLGLSQIVKYMFDSATITIDLNDSIISFKEGNKQQNYIVDWKSGINYSYFFLDSCPNCKIYDVLLKNIDTKQQYGILFVADVNSIEFEISGYSPNMECAYSIKGEGIRVK